METYTINVYPCFNDNHEFLNRWRVVAPHCNYDETFWSYNVAIIVANNLCHKDCQVQINIASVTPD